MQRIVILGGPGSGKSTLARRLADRLGLDLVHLDALNFAPGWVEVDTAELQRRLSVAIAGERWVTDGNYTSKTAIIRLARADTILWLEQPRWKRMIRVVRRSLIHYGRTRADMGEGCPERLDWAFLLFAWRYDRNNKSSILERVRTAAPDLPITVLNGDREIEALIVRVSGSTETTQDRPSTG